MEKGGSFNRYQCEVQTFTNTITSEYNSNFCQTNEKRVDTFFKQLRADSCKMYSEKMQSVFDVAKSYFEETDLLKIHDIAKDISMALVCFHFTYRMSQKI